MPPGTAIGGHHTVSLPYRAGASHRLTRRFFESHPLSMPSARPPCFSARHHVTSRRRNVRNAHGHCLVPAACGLVRRDGVSARPDGKAGQRYARTVSICAQDEGDAQMLTRRCVCVLTRHQVRRARSESVARTVAYASTMYVPLAPRRVRIRGEAVRSVQGGHCPEKGHMTTRP